jgi:hypothetical protein
MKVANCPVLLASKFGKVKILKSGFFFSQKHSADDSSHCDLCAVTRAKMTTGMLPVSRWAWVANRAKQSFKGNPLESSSIAKLQRFAF